MKIQLSSKSLALSGLIGTTIGTIYLVNAEDLDGDGFHEFVSGTGISSSQMNYNFDQVVGGFGLVNQSIDGLNQSVFDLDNRLSLFEGAISIDGDNIGISGSVSAADFFGDGSSLTNLNASSLTSGTVAPGRLGSGTADSSTFLRRDGAWATPASGLEGSGTANYLPLFTNGTTLENSTIYQSGSNIGIGTTSAEASFHVLGSTSLTLPGTSFGGIGYVDPQETNRISVAFNDSSPVPISNSTTSSSAFWKVILRGFWVNDYEGAGLAQPAPNIELTSGSPSIYIGSIALTISRDATTGRLVGLTSSSTSSKQIVFSGNVDILVNNVTNNAGSNSITVPGNIGIGTTNPVSPLEIYTDSGTNGQLRLRTPQDVADNGTVFLRLNDINNSAGYMGFGGTSNRLDIWNYKPGALVFGTNAAEQMRIDSSGNVGIGTTSPRHSLDVNGRAIFGDQGKAYTFISDGGNIDSGNFIIWVNADESRQVGIGQAVPNGGEVTDDMIFSTYSAGWVEKMRLTNLGNVGIGTTTPSARLDVVSADLTVAGLFTVASASTNVTSATGQPLGLRNSDPTPGNYSAIVFRDANRNHQGSIGMKYGNHTDLGQGDFYIEPQIVSNPSSFVVKSTGNVGIGTSSPTEKLDVAGTIIADAVIEESDQRLKWDISPLEHASDIMHCLQAVTYRWIDPEAPQSLQIGLIAQEVEVCLPEAVHTDATGYKSVAYSRLVVPLIQNAQEMQQALDAEQAINAVQLGQIQALESRVRVQQAVMSEQQTQNLVQQKTIDDLTARLERLENLVQKR